MDGCFGCADPVKPFVLALAALLAAGCEPTSTQSGEEPAFDPEYISINTRLLDGDLVQFTLVMRGARDDADLRDFGDCAAAQYALIRDFGFARHVRTNVVQEVGLWRADAVYTISAGLPRGTSTLDAEVTVANCREAGIPTV